jgi:hypothetical protein
VSPDTIRIFLLCLCWPVVLLRIPAVRVADQKLLWFTLVMQGTGLTVLQAPVMKQIQTLTGVPRIESLISSSLASVVAVLLLTVALRISTSDATASRWSKRVALYCGATLTTMIVTFSIVTSQKIPTRERFLPMPGEFTAHMVYWIAYLSYMIILSGCTAFLLWRQVPRIATKVLRAALISLAIGTTFFLGFLGLRVAALFNASSQLPAVGVYVSSVYSAGVTIGCSLAIIMPFSHGVANWWRANRLYSLWWALCDASPHIALHPPRGRLADALTLRDSTHRLHRRIVEIRDGLLIMREWITPATYDRIAELVARENLSERDAEAAATASWLKIALDAKARGLERVPKPLDLAGHGGVDSDSELRWLTAVAKAWASPLATKYSTTVAAQPLPS